MINRTAGQQGNVQNKLQYAYPDRIELDNLFSLNTIQFIERMEGQN